MKIAGNKLIVECSAYDFKKELEKDPPESWMKSISAFANGEGGALYYGVENDGTVAGLADPQKTADDISQLIKDHMDPVPLFTLTPETGDDGKVVLEVKVAAGSQTPYYYVWKKKRIAFVRLGNESVVADSHQLFNLVLKGSNRSWDSLVSNELRSKHTFNMLEREYNERSGAKWEESLLSSFGLVTDDGHLTNAGLLFVDQCPIKQSRLYCTRWAGLDKDDTINDGEFQGNLLYNLKMAKGFIKANTAVPWFKLPDYRLNLPEYSERAIEEMCVNHLIHRDYTELGAEVAINIYDDRIETTSPGGITDSFNPVKLDLSKVSSKRRNPIIAEVFAQLDYMEKRGSGLRKIITETSLLPTYKEERKPSFDSSRSFFYTTIPNVNYGMDRAALENFANSRKDAPEYRPEDEIKLTENRPEGEKPTQKNHPEGQKTAQKNHPESEKTAQKKIGKTAQKIIDILVANPHCTRAELCSMLDKSDGTVKEHLANLQERGILQRIGSDKAGFWKVLIRN